MHKQNKLRELYSTWVALTKLHAKQGRLILDLLSHPECTPDYLVQITPTLSDFRETRAALIKHRPIVQAALEKERLHTAAYEVQHWEP